MSSVAFNVPINSVSFGQISTLLLKTYHKKVLAGEDLPELRLFPLGGQVDLASQAKDDLFELWLQKRSLDALENHPKTDPCFKLWHLVGSLESFSKEQSLLSFYELDAPTKTEVNIVKNNKTFFTSKYTCDIFKSCGANCDYIPLAFDDFNFKRTGKKYFDDDRIVFSLVGKMEKRKRHDKVLRAWTKRFGNDKKYALHCALYNHFLSPDQNNGFIHKALDGKQFFNVNFLNYMGENEVYNDYLNAADIVIGMSGGEGWGLPEFHSVGLGKYGVIMNAHGYKEWANEKNSVLIEPSGKIDSEDGIFFHRGKNHNQGQIFDFNEDEFIAGCEKALEKLENNKVNEEGLKLQKDFTREKLLNNVLSSL
jgi:glycosyltransferase involved in cell wall biosynthesis